MNSFKYEKKWSSGTHQGGLTTKDEITIRNILRDLKLREAS